VRQILTFSRKEATPQQRFDLGAIAHEAMGMLRAIVPATIKIDVALAPVPPLLDDPGQWHRVLVNLVSNVAKAIGTAHGRIAVELLPAADGLELAVADTAAVWTRRPAAGSSSRSSRRVTSARAPGSACRWFHGIVADHGGRIAVDSTPGAGTRFIVRLPAAPVATATAETKASPAEMTA
jgi:two-component system cell cycle sensor histidine kinase/response regulator CckA